MKLTKIFFLGVLIFSTWALVSCDKNEFLDKKPNTSLVVPGTLDDCQKLLSYYNVMNLTIDYGETSTCEYYLLDYNSWQSLPIQYRNMYIWQSDIYEGVIDQSIPWNDSYRQILTSNVVFETLTKITQTSSNQSQWDIVKGAAHFFRGFAYFDLAQIFCLPYDESTTDKDLGLPLRLSADVNEIKPRSNLKETYDLIINDLLLAADLLPNSIHYDYRNRPSKPAALALLSRLYLTMRDYDMALKYADESLQLYNELMDFNDIIDFNRAMTEVLFQSQLGNGHIVLSYRSPFTIIDPSLYNSYSDYDLRKTRFFRMVDGYPRRNMSYNGTIYGFGGLATDELYLTKAECLARKNELEGALYIINQLLEKRYITGTFTPIVSNNKEELLDMILLERRKELCFRGLHWQDIRRLNKEGANITLTRTLNGQTYSLLPNSSKYALPIPPGEILFSGISQNSRD